MAVKSGTGRHAPGNDGSPAPGRLLQRLQKHYVRKGRCMRVCSRYVCYWLIAWLALAPSLPVSAAQRPRGAAPTASTQQDADKELRDLQSVMERSCRQGNLGDAGVGLCLDGTRRLADWGEARAMAELGWRYIERAALNRAPSYKYQVGVSPNNREALSWMRKSAEQGNPYGMTYVGWMYQMGYGVERDPAQAETWLRRGAEGGVKRAMALLGAMQLSGDGIRRNEVEGEQWLRRAAESEDMRANTILALVRLERGVKKGQAVADEDPYVLLNRACASRDDWSASTGVLFGIGDPLACYHLGLLYASGAAGFPRDLDRAGIAFLAVEGTAAYSDDFSRAWGELGNGLAAEIRLVARKGAQQYAPQFSSRPPTGWDALIAAALVLFVGAALLDDGSGNTRKPNDDDPIQRQIEESRRMQVRCSLLGQPFYAGAGGCPPF